MHTWNDWAFLDLFEPDAVYVEPFSGTRRTHRGTAAIKASFTETWKEPPPNFRIAMNRVDVEGPKVRAEWTCTWDGLGGEMRGVDEFEVHDGRIRRLDVSVTSMPPQSAGA